MKTFIEYLEANQVTEAEISFLNESLNSEWTPELEARVERAIEEFFEEFKCEDGS